MNNFKRVLIISPYYRLRKGGIASVIQLYKKNLARNFKYAPSIYFQNLYLSLLFFPINILIIGVILLLNRNLKILHIHGSHGGSFFRKLIIFWIGKNLFKKKIVYHLHSSDFKEFYSEASNKTKEKIKYLLSNADLIIVLSEGEDYIVNNFTTKQIRVLENIVEKQKQIDPIKRDDKTNLLFLGRIGERKGVFDLLECLNTMDSSNRKKITLTIGGDGEVDRLQRKIKDYQLDNVYFEGWVKGKRKSELLINSDIFILPSYNEGLPISLLEAMSYGKPIISTNVGGIPRILKNERNGFIIEPGNKKQLQKAIISYVNDKQLAGTHGAEGLKMVEKYYPNSVLEKLNAIYSEIL